MSANHDSLASRMFPDFYLSAPARGAAGAVLPADRLPEPTTQPVTIAEVLASVDLFYQTIAEQTSSRLFPLLGQSGIAARGEYWTVGTAESPSGDDVCSVSLRQILETEDDWLQRNPDKTREDWQVYLKHYYLSKKAASGVLRRAQGRGRAIPPMLEQALKMAAKE